MTRNDSSIPPSGEANKLPPASHIAGIQAAELRNYRHQTILKILDGIDRTETDTPPGWWETSEAAEFGKRKLEEIKALFDA